MSESYELEVFNKHTKSTAMKFNHSLQFNAVPEWSTKYIDYAALKKVIYTLEKEQLNSQTGSSDETQSLMSSNPVGVFTKALDKELTKISDFYSETEAKIFGEFDDFVEDYNELDDLSAPDPNRATDSSRQFLYRGALSHADRQTSEGASSVPAPIKFSSQPKHLNDGPHTPLSVSGVATPDRPALYRPGGGDSLMSEDNHSDTGSHSSASSTRGRSHSVSSARSVSRSSKNISDYTITLKRRCIRVYVSLSELRSYLDLNMTGFTKALKKFDKIMRTELRPKYLGDVVQKAYPFMESTEQNVDSRIQEIIKIYSNLVTNGHIHEAEQELKLHLREHIVWERNTVWRDMIHIERESHGTKLQVAEKKLQYVRFGKISIPAVFLGANFFKGVIIGIIFLSLLVFPTFESTSQSNCLAVVVVASLLWATETMPLFVTSLLVPFLIVVLRIPLDSDGKRMSAEDASKFIFSQMWSSVIMILLGGFTLAAVLSKYQIAKTLATIILSRAGTNPRVILLTLMFVSTFLSMWISNVAAPVLCYSLAQPLLRTLPGDSGFAKAIILGIALASNIGGMVSPIASPQNIIALENMHPEPSWGQWFLVAIPVAVAGLFLIWLVLILSFPLDKGDETSASNAVNHIRSNEEGFNLVQWFICFVSILTIVLWCFSHQLEPYVGEMGVLALIPLVVFFGTGLLTAADFNNFLWTIIALAMGGIALGKAVSSSGLLATIAVTIEKSIHGMGLFGVMSVFGFMILVIATFVSHTVAALICLPLIESVGKQMEDPHPVLLVMASALMCSAAMGLPTSGFPNVTAICMTNDLGKPYLTVGNFITRGVPSSLLVYLVIITLGYLMMMICGF